MRLFCWFFALVLLIAGCSEDPNASFGGTGLTQQQISKLKSDVETAEKALDSYGIAFKASEREEISGPSWNKTTYSVYEVRFSSNPELADPKTDLAGIFEACKTYYRLSGTLLKNSGGLSEREKADLSLKQNLIFQFTFPIARIQMEVRAKNLENTLAEYGLSFSTGVTEFVLGEGAAEADFTTMKPRLQDAKQRLVEALDLMPIDLLARKSFVSDSVPSYQSFPSYDFDRLSSTPAARKPPSFGEMHSEFVDGRFQEAAKAKIRLIDQLMANLGDGDTSEEVRAAVDSIFVIARKNRLEANSRHFASEIAALATSAGVSFTTDASGVLVIDAEARRNYVRKNRFVGNFGKLTDTDKGKIESLARLGESLSSELRKENPSSEEAAQIDRKISLLRGLLKEN